MRWNTATVSESAQWRSSKTIAARRPSRISPTSCAARSRRALSGAWPSPERRSSATRGVVGGQVVAEDVEQQLERAAEAAGIGLAGEHEAVVGQAGEELPHEAGLADAGLATDERDAWAWRG